MSDPAIRPRSALADCRMYFENARVLVDDAELQHKHIELTQTAAMVAMAESLDRLADAAWEPTNRRRVQVIAVSLRELTKELTKIRYLVKG